MADPTLRDIADSIAHLEKRLDGRLEQMDGRFTQIDGKLVQIDGRLAHHDAKFDAVNERLDTLNRTMHVLHEDVKSEFRFSLEAVAGAKESLSAQMAERNRATDEKFDLLMRAIRANASAS